MAKQFPELDDGQRKFIEEQHMFFVGTAAPDGRVNISPKGMDSLRVLGPNRIACHRERAGGGGLAARSRGAGRLC